MLINLRRQFIRLGSVCRQFGIGLRSVWGRFEIGLGSVGDLFAIGLGSVWHRFGIEKQEVQGKIGEILWNIRIWGRI